MSEGTGVEQEQEQGQGQKQAQEQEHEHYLVSWQLLEPGQHLLLDMLLRQLDWEPVVRVRVRGDLVCILTARATQ